MSKPEIGQWYQHLDKGELFQVTGVDGPSGTVEIQYFGGDLDEVDLESWDELPLELAEPPEDWTGPMDDIERDDLGDAEPQSQPEPQGLEPWDEARDGVPPEIDRLAGEED